MAICKIEWKPSALKEVSRIDRQYIPRIFHAVELLAENPFPAGVRKLQGVEHTYRLRVGEYRVVYQVFENRLLIVIVRVRHRKEAYR